MSAEDGILLPQRGSCLCGDLAYVLLEDPLTLYACHCTDCQRQSGSSFALSLIVRSEALRIVRGSPAQYSVELGEWRERRATFCARCSTRLFGPSSAAGLSVFEPGTLADTSWLRPVAHIWVRSAQSWLEIPDGELTFSEQPGEDDWPALVRAWRHRQ